MKKVLLPAMVFVMVFLTDTAASAQRGRYNSRPMRHVYRSRPIVSIGIGGMWGGFYGPRMYGYGWSPHMRGNLGVMISPTGADMQGSQSNVVQQEINGIIYFRRGDTFYRQKEEGGYVQVPPPVGAALSRLPLGARLQNIDGKNYYEKYGTLYYREIAADGRPLYIIAGKNGVISNEELDNEVVNDVDNQNATFHHGNTMPDQNTGISSGNGNFTVKPQPGDQFEQLPRNCREVLVDGQKQFISPGGVYYKEVNIDNKVIYEVVK